MDARWESGRRLSIFVSKRKLQERRGMEDLIERLKKEALDHGGRCRFLDSVLNDARKEIIRLRAIESDGKVEDGK